MITALKIHIVRQTAIVTIKTEIKAALIVTPIKKRNDFLKVENSLGGTMNISFPLMKKDGNTVGETLGNYAENIGIGAIGGTAGHNIGKLMFGRSNFPPERGLYEQTVGTVMGGVYNMLNKR